mgnify:CR=1 FL=1
MLFCVVGKKELVHLKEMIDEIDPNAFVIVGDAREVHGERIPRKIAKINKKVVKSCVFLFIFGDLY